jgi:tetratricopeptide (TPR) repeat protein
MVNRFALVLVSTCALALVPATTLNAAGGGGGGGGMGGSMPSNSAPSYDPAEEYRKGVEALKAKDFKTAKRAFDRVIAVAPKDANTQYLAGLARTGLNDFKGATRFLEKAVKLDPALIGAQQELGVAYARSGEAAKAQEVLKGLQDKSSACGPTCGQAGQLKAAIDAVTQAASGAAPVTSMRLTPAFDAPTGDKAYLGAVALINEGRFADAISALQASRQAFGPHPDILTYLGFANRKLKRFDVAEDYYRQALAIAPDHRGATEYFGELMVERGDLAGARHMLARLEATCQFNCAEADELRRWVIAGRSPHSA